VGSEEWEVAGLELVVGELGGEVEELKMMG